MNTGAPTVWIAIADERVREAILAGVGAADRTSCVAIELERAARPSAPPVLVVADASAAVTAANLGVPVVVVGEVRSPQRLPEGCVIAPMGNLQAVVGLISIALRFHAGSGGKTGLQLAGLDKYLPGAVYTCDVAAQWRVLQMSEGVESLCGRPASAFLDGSIRWTGLIHPDDVESVDAAIEAAFAEDKPYEIEYRIVHSDGSIRWVHDRGRLAPEGERAGRLATGVALDVTDRVAARQDLAASEANYRGLTENSVVGVSRTTLDGRLLGVNRAYAAIFGYADPDEMIASVANAASLYADPSDRPETMEEARETGRISPREIAVKRRDGATAWVLHGGRAVFGADGEIDWFEGMSIDVTDRKRAEEDAREARKMMETALGASPVGLVTFKASGPLVWANEELARIVGGTLDEIQTHNFRTLQSWKDSPLLALAEEALATGTPRQSEIDGFTTFGKHWMVHAQLVPFTFNREQHLLLVAEDVTEQKRAEEALRASESKLAQVFQVIPDAIIISDAETGEVLDVNEAFERLFGYSRAEIVGRTTVDLTVWVSADERIRYLERYVHEGCVRSHEVVLRDRRGREFWAELSTDPLDLGGRAWALSVVRDISGRRQAVEALNASELFLRESQRAGRIGSFELDIPSGRWRCSEAMDELLGIDSLYPHTVDGWLQLVHPEEREAMSAYFSQVVVGSGKPFDREYRIKTPRRGEVKWVHGLASLDLDEAGKPSRLIGTIQDVTERKQAEEALVEARDELERRVVVRTAQLEAANREQESFSYSVSHDLRGPLRAMDGYSRILLADHAEQLDEEGRNYIRRIIEAADRMGQLVDDLLRLSRVNRAEVRTERVDMSALVTEIARKLQESDPNRRVAFSIAPGVVAEGDSVLLSALLENLLGNAWKYTGKHEQAHIRFGVSRRRGKATYFVKDDGAGFDMAYADNLFAPFHRLHHEAEYSGTGIGLATARRIVERHGGTIWAEGEVERGATFCFTLGEAVPSKPTRP